MRRFHSWLLGAGSRNERGLSRADRRDMVWCWNVPVPEPVVTGEVYTALMADGTYLDNWCLIVAYNGQHVIGWQWAEKENKAAYLAALSRFPPPKIVIIDGHRAAFEAVRQIWPGVLIQRCLFHTKARVRQLITMHPRTQCGIEIKQLTDMLTAITNPIQASSWLVAYYQWEQRWQYFLKERTYHGMPDTSWHDTRRWQYTHRDLRSIRSMYRSMINNETLFAYLTPLISNPNAQPLPRTTSPLEGGINAGVKDLLRRHRGMSEPHATRAVDWYLNSRSENPADPVSLILPEHWQPNHKTRITIEQAHGPVFFDNHYNSNAPWEDGIWVRKGWAGRYKP